MQYFSFLFVNSSIRDSTSDPGHRGGQKSANGDDWPGGDLGQVGAAILPIVSCGMLLLRLLAAQAGYKGRSWLPCGHPLETRV